MRDNKLLWFIAIAFVVYVFANLGMEARTRQRKDEHAVQFEKRVDDAIKNFKERRKR